MPIYMQPEDTEDVSNNNPILSHNQNLLWDVLERAFEGVVVIDPECKIIFMNQTYQNFLGVRDVVGRQVTDVIENTRMHIVAQTRKAELSAMQRIKGSEMIAHRIPIVHDDELMAVVGTVVFQDVRELRALTATVERLRQEVDYYKEELRRKLVSAYGFDHIIGSSAKMTAVKAFAQKVAKSDTTVLVTGESGTGKELFAHAIHADSRRAKGPLIRVNCAAIPEGLLESELFGYEEGAFTGAVRKGRKGKFELAHHGTILLDEIGDMPMALQAKLLRVLQEREIERIGGSRPIPVDVRFLSSTNRNLRELITAGLFREDLFYRLNVVTLHVPPLRERLDDLPELVLSILEQLADSTAVRVKTIDEDVWRVLRNHSWPGNVRELRNVLERALHLMEGDRLTAEHIALPLSEQRESVAGVKTLKQVVRAAEKAAIFNALAATNGDKIAAAKLLDISKSSFYQKIDLYTMDV